MTIWTTLSLRNSLHRKTSLSQSVKIFFKYIQLYKGLMLRIHEELMQIGNKKISILIGKYVRDLNMLLTKEDVQHMICLFN